MCSRLQTLSRSLTLRHWLNRPRSAAVSLACILLLVAGRSLTFAKDGRATS